METRREFLKKTTAVTAMGLFSGWASSCTTSDKIGSVLPTRQLLRTGEKVTSFCLGGYHAGVTDDLKEAEKIIETAIEMGVRFFDNARVYHSGKAEEYYGKFLTPKYREDVFLMTKAHTRTGDDVKKDLDSSLKALKTDYVDLWQIHTLLDRVDVDNRINAGVLDAFLEAKEKGKAKHIGFTAHQNPSTILYFLDFLKERGLELETCQMPLNVCDPSFESFEKEALPVLMERGYGVIAMKTMSGGSMMGKRIDTTPQHIKTEDIPNVVEEAGITYANLHQYVYALPVSSLCSGCETVAKVKENINVLKNLKKLSKDEMGKLIERAKPYAGDIVENYKRIFS